MASYDYRCRTCGDVFEVRRGIDEDAGDVRCDLGHPDVTRVWSAVAVGGLSSVSAASRPAAGASAGCCGGGCCG